MKITEHKKTLRQNLRTLRDGFGEEFIKTASAKVCENIVSCREFVKADTILLYFPVKNELSVLPLIDTAKKLNIKIAFPVCEKTTKPLIFKEIDSLDELKSADFGLLEPCDTCKEAHLTQSSLCIVPALAFSHDGYRIGYGGGYYDQYLRAHPKTKRIAYGFDFQILKEVPCEPFDEKMDEIVTDKRCITLASRNEDK